VPEWGASDVKHDEAVVRLPHQALAVIELLEAAAKANCNVMWDSSN
jgi:hypothetical protein